MNAIIMRLGTRRSTLATSAAVAQGAHLTCAQPYRRDC